MAAASSPILIPVIYSDGRYEFDAGNIPFDPSLCFEKLQSIIGLRIGVDPLRIGIFLSCRRKPRSRVSYRKIPIHRNFDLTAIAREKSCYFYVVPKPSPAKRERRRRPCRDFRDSNPIPTILCRERPEKNEIIAESLGLGSADYESKIRELQRQTEYQSRQNPCIWSDGTDGVKRITCEQCLSEERPIPFHLCINDAVTVDFRSPAGPIERPNR